MNSCGVEVSIPPRFSVDESGEDGAKTLRSFFDVTEAEKKFVEN